MSGAASPSVRLRSPLPIPIPRSNWPQLVTQRMLERRGSAGALLASLWDWPQETYAKAAASQPTLHQFLRRHVTARH